MRHTRTFNTTKDFTNVHLPDECLSSIIISGHARGDPLILVWKSRVIRSAYLLNDRMTRFEKRYEGTLAPTMDATWNETACYHPLFTLRLCIFFYLCHWRTNFKLKRYWKWIIKLINFDLKLSLFSIIILTILSTPHPRHNTTRKYCATHHSHSPSLRRKHLFNHATMSSQPGEIDFNYVSRSPRPL